MAAEDADERRFAQVSEKKMWFEGESDRDGGKLSLGGRLWRGWCERLRGKRGLCESLSRPEWDLGSWWEAKSESGSGSEDRRWKIEDRKRTEGARVRLGG